MSVNQKAADSNYCSPITNRCISIIGIPALFAPLPGCRFCSALANLILSARKRSIDTKTNSGWWRKEKWGEMERRKAQTLTFQETRPSIGHRLSSTDVRAYKRHDPSVTLRDPITTPAFPLTIPHKHLCTEKCLNQISVGACGILCRNGSGRSSKAIAEWKQTCRRR